MRTFGTTLTVLTLALSAMQSASAANVVNGSFETGDFTGWIATDLAEPFFPLSVQTLGSANTFEWPWSSTPTDGAFTAFSGFDGVVGTISIAQDVGIIDASSSLLTFDYRGTWDLLNFCSGCSNRLFDVIVEPAGGGVPLGSFNIITANAGTIADTGQLTGNVNLTPFLGQNVRLSFVLNVTDNFSGPAQFQLDNISVGVVPEPASLALFGLGLAGLAARLRKMR